MNKINILLSVLVLIIFVSCEKQTNSAGNFPIAGKSYEAIYKDENQLFGDSLKIVYVLDYWGTTTTYHDGSFRIIRKCSLT